jgi:hypothetical protein
VATAVSASSVNRPSTPSPRNSWNSAGLSPLARRNSGLAGFPWRKSWGRKVFSFLKVNGWTSRPAWWASRIRLVGRCRWLELSPGTIRFLLGPIPLA